MSYGFADAARSRVAVLRNRQFRRLLAGRAVSVLGDGLYSVAAMWLVYEMTGSTAYTGLAGFLSRAPGILKVFVGPLVDRAPLGRTLTLSELAQASLVLLVPIAAAFGHLNVVVVLTVMPLLALANLFSGPAQNATIPRIVPDERLVRANSVGQVVTKASDATARGVAGVLIAAIGGVALYLVDAATFVLAAILLGSLSIPARESEKSGSSDADAFDFDGYVEDLREGLDLLADSVLGRMLVASLFANFLTGVALAVLPAFAEGIGGAELYGLLLAGMTVGTVAGSVLASFFDRYPLGRTTIAGLVVSGLAWAGAVVLPGRLLTVALFAASRVPLGVYNVSVSATLQTGVPDDLLGRVSAVVGSATSLVLPAGMLLGGLAGTRFGSNSVMFASALGSVLMAGYWLAIPSLRRFGPPTEVASGEFYRA
ncbi:MFS transporter [Halorussus halophilus]|uniref:MFS transporter n=1 Tax=Halorussus halophilus TaxID=2650975 RepID=UPI0017878B30|nr:MFS transporter [Halorussus halophilus]